MIADCARSHVAWISLLARSGGGATGRAGAVDWAFVPAGRTLHLLFPDGRTATDLAEVGRVAAERNADDTLLWSARDRREPELRVAGFTAGWQPWWMQVEPERLRGGGTGRVRLVEPVRAGARLDDRAVLLAEAREGDAVAGSAWLHVDGEVAGLYDMAVDPEHRRRGLGRELLTLLVEEARARGARRVVLNATPQGAVLYAACGFRLLGAGRTWWRRPVR